MAASFVGWAGGRPVDVGALVGGAVADGDWLIWFTYYSNTMTVAFAAPAGWIQLRKTVGASATIEVWMRQWHTGDPMSWTINVTGYSYPTSADMSFLMVWRDLAGTPSIISTTHESTSGPAVADPITDPAIGNNDIALGLFAANATNPTGGGTFDSSGGGTGTGGPPGILFLWARLTTGGFAPGGTAPVVATEVFGLQVILPDVPIAPPPPPRNLMARKPGQGRLGCGTGGAFITWKGGAPRFCDLQGTTEITWGRDLNDISEAEVVVTLGGVVDEACCALLGDIEPWCHELHITRDSQVPWLGPVTEVIYEADKVTIRAKDMLAWTTVRVSEEPIDFTTATGSGPADWTTMAEEILAVAFAEDDPAVLPYVSATLTGYVGEQLFPAYTDTAFGQLDALAGTGLDYTTVGRTIILSSENTPASAIATLTDGMIIGPVQLTKTGLLQGNRWFVHFDKDEEAIPPRPGMAEAADKQCYGLIERIRSTDVALANVESADVTAGIYVAASAIAPRLLEVPEGSRISPDAPWDIMAMIPGCRVNVAVEQLCVAATQSFRLTAVSVRQRESDEEVTVTLGPLNIVEGL